MSGLQVREVMNRDVVVLGPSSTVSEAASEFAIYGIPGAPVINKNGKLIGLLSEEDILTYVKSKDGTLVVNPSLSIFKECFTGSFQNEEVCKLYNQIGNERVENIMTEEVISVTPNDEAEEALETMVRFNVNRLPVVDNNDVLVGMLEREDLIYQLHRAKTQGIIHD